ncbi:LapA family protein [Nocardioides aurantiacus]|uniref:Putative integral membrane protein n=1 Tax=Nocardioides aurantiacus TaxID=86796 RepID=A0A3N2CSM8_9ACTN|nr:lipopolysaccharide assembly protein LapA domain-containing protein [Nocardioides aurantiacus]ROR90541.1 putative integral membrane protein [Nocardioides aurantiacus]
MSTEHPSPTEPGSPASASADEAPATRSTGSGSAKDPLRGSRTSGIWSATVALIVVLILLAVFILQNTQRVEVSYFGWTGQAPLSATLLIAAAGGALLVASAGALRILQLRRRVKKDRKRR